MDDRDSLLADVFMRLADTLVDDFDVVEFLSGLSADAVAVLGAETAGVMLTDGSGGLRLVASSEERMRRLELFELQNMQGPCLDAFRIGDSVTATAAQGQARWPTFAPAAAEQGMRFMCAVPLALRGQVIGALNLFRASDEPFSANEMLVARAMAQVAATGLLQQRSIAERELLAAQLQHALASRVIIEQAKGMLAEYLGVGVDEAFSVLRSAARSTNRKLTDVAREVVEKRVGPEAFVARRS